MSSSRDTSLSATMVDLSSSRAKQDHRPPSADSTVDRVASIEGGKTFKEDVNENDDGPPRDLLNRRQPVRRIWKDGPVDNADSEHVSTNEPS